MKKRKILLNISLTQLGITFLFICAIMFIVVWEIPRRDFPQTSLFFSDVRIDYWSDIFFPTISVPVIFIVIITVLNILGLFLSFWIAKWRSLFWVIGVLISTLVDLLFIWASILWVHGALGCIADDLRYAQIFGCEFNFQPELMHIAIGALFSIFIIVLQTLWGRRFFLITYTK
jgi:hypothetical protein